MKISPVGSELFHAYRRTDTTKVIVVFGNFAKAPNRTTKCYMFLNKLVITVLQEIVSYCKKLNIK